MPEGLIGVWERMATEEKERVLGARERFLSILGDRPLGSVRLSPIAELQRLNDLMAGDQEVLALASQFSPDEIFAMARRRRELQEQTGATP